MKKKLNLNKKLLPLFGLAIGLSGTAQAQLSVTALNAEVRVDFDNGLAGVNNGTYTAIPRPGIASTPAAGALDSDAWRVEGLAAGDTTFGDDFSGLSFSRGTNPGGSGTSGLNAFSDVGGTNIAMGIQPAANDFSPGNITLRVQNNTGAAVSQWDLAYELWVYEDGGESRFFNWDWSIDDTTYNSLNTFSTVAGFQSAQWTNPVSASIASVNAAVADGGFLYLRWSGGYNTGVSGRDEFAIDDISVTAIPESSAFAVLAGVLSLGCVALRRRR